MAIISSETSTNVTRLYDVTIKKIIPFIVTDVRISYPMRRTR